MPKSISFVLASCLLLFVPLSGTSASDIAGKVTAKGAKHAGDAVVYIDKISAKAFDPPKQHVTMDQKNLVFIPHVLPVLSGTSVDFLNSDDVLHNVFTPDKCAGKFNLGSWPKGQVRSFTFNQVGCAPVMLCNVHPEMEAFIFVSPTPYFAVSAKDGSYSIKNVPAGKYTLNIWHEKLKGKPVEITIPETGTVTADFLLTR